jgi:immunoglobulin-like protein involved in spore germination/sporulation and spore germination protein
MRSAAASAVIGLALLAAACGSSEDDTGGASPPAPPPPPPATTTATEPEGEAAQVAVYFVRDGKLGFAQRTIGATPRIATATLEELLAGPDHVERKAGLASEIPAGTELESLTIADGTASVELSSSLDGLSTSQVAETLFQFDTVDRVRLGGREYLRADTEEALPAILVEAPAPGATVSSPLTIRGTANTFEATFMVDLRADGQGKPLYSNFVTATSGNGTRGTFEESIDFTVDRERPGTLVVYERSAEDGSVVNEVEIPVTITP